MDANIPHHLQPKDADLFNEVTSMGSFNHPSLGSETSALARYLGTHPVIDLGSPRQRRRLEYVKCDFCRRSKKKVSVLKYHMRLIPPILPNSPLITLHISPTHPVPRSSPFHNPRLPLLSARLHTQDITDNSMRLV